MISYSDARAQALAEYKDTGEYPLRWRFAAQIFIKGQVRTVSPVDSTALFEACWGDFSPLQNLMRWCRTQQATMVLNIGVVSRDRTIISWAKTPPVVNGNLGGLDFEFKSRFCHDLGGMDQQSIQEGRIIFKSFLKYYALEVIQGGIVYTTKLDPNTLDVFDHYAYQATIPSFNVASVVELKELEEQIVKAKERKTQSQLLLEQYEKAQDDLKLCLYLFQQLHDIMEEADQIEMALRNSGKANELRLDFANIRSRLSTVLHDVGYFSKDTECGYIRDAEKFERSIVVPLKERMLLLKSKYQGVRS